MLEMMMKVSEPDTSQGQALFTTSSPELIFTVPDNITSICAVAIGAGRGWGGGGLSWRNNIPVTPGEQLTVIVAPNAILRRGSENLVIAMGTVSGVATGGKGGKNASPINDGGGNGGDGVGVGGGNGGAGGYTGNGGRGMSSGSGMPGSGGGGGGGVMGTVDGNNRQGFGGGVLPYGQGANGIGGVGGTHPTGSTTYWGAQGSSGDGTTRGYTYGGGTTLANATGCVRIIWGEDRYFPSNRTHDV